MKLKTYLEERQISQADFALQIGVTQSMVSQWLTGRRPVSPEAAVRIEQITGIAAESLCPRIAALRPSGAAA